MAIKDWPSSERPREKLLQHNTSILSDAELLAILFRTGRTGKTAVDLGREVLQHFGSLRKLLNADIAELKTLPGLGPAKYACLQAALEVGKRYLDERLMKDGPLTSSSQAQQYFSHQLRDQVCEVFAILYLDNRNRVIQYEELFKGTIHSTHIHPREVVRQSLKFNAAAIIIAHNHPSGIAEPSTADSHLTHRLKDALALVDIRLLDHIIVGDGECMSFSDQDLL